MDSDSLMLAGYNAMSQSTQAALSYGTHKADRKFNAEQARINREWQEKMWNLSNQYNHPQQQMERLKEAGLNPNLVYGDGATTLAAHVGNVSTPSAPNDNIKYPDLGLSVLNALAGQKMQAETSKIEADELLARETAKKVQEETKGVSVRTMFDRDSYQLRLDQLAAENSLKTALEATQVSERNKIEAEIKSIEANEEYVRGQTKNEKALTDAKIDEINQNIDNSIKQTAALCANLKEQAAKANAEAWLARVEASIKDTPEYKDAVVNKAIFEAYNAMLQGDERKIETSLKQLKYLTISKPGEPGWLLKQYTERFITPITESFGHVFGGVMSMPVKP